MANWTTKYLSGAGIEILLKVFLQAIPTYTMSIFLLPKGIITRLNNLYKNFWWGFIDTASKIQWIDQGKLGLAKEMGGMGVRDVLSFNLAMLAKQCWRIFTNPSSLVSQMFKQKYHPLLDFLKANNGKYPSFVWRILISGRSLLQKSLM